MDRDLAQALALLQDARGYLDKLSVAAQELYDRASKLQSEAEAYSKLVQQVSEKQAELAGVRADIDEARKAFDAFKKIAAAG